MKIDITRPVKTRDGRRVEIISNKGRAGRPLVGYVEDYENTMAWASDGKYYRDATISNNDLLQEPEKKTWWVNVYPHDAIYVFPNKAAAEHEASVDRIACVKVTYIDGQFDEE